MEASHDGSRGDRGTPRTGAQRGCSVHGDEGQRLQSQAFAAALGLERVGPGPQLRVAVDDVGAVPVGGTELGVGRRRRRCVARVPGLARRPPLQGHHQSVHVCGVAHRSVGRDIDRQPLQARVRCCRGRVGDDRGRDEVGVGLRKLQGAGAALGGARHDDLVRVAVELLNDGCRDVLDGSEVGGGPSGGIGPDPALGHDHQGIERVGKSAVGHWGTRGRRRRAVVVRLRRVVGLRVGVVASLWQAPAGAVVEGLALVPGQHARQALRVHQAPLALRMAVKVDDRGVGVQRVVAPLSREEELVLHAVHFYHASAGADAGLGEDDGVPLLPLRLVGEVPCGRARLGLEHGRAQPRLAPLRDPGCARDLIAARHEGGRAVHQRCRDDRASKPHGWDGGARYV
mmetsp:Transcript_108304/g.282587  ORF Transcript_108304/g.282587 Transcript_108304/m.282587 type:complete len:399 (+) Transcript_108304:1-1197(+)